MQVLQVPPLRSTTRSNLEEAPFAEDSESNPLIAFPLNDVCTCEDIEDTIIREM